MHVMVKNNSNSAATDAMVVIQRPVPKIHDYNFDLLVSSCKGGFETDGLSGTYYKNGLDYSWAKSPIYGNFHRQFGEIGVRCKGPVMLILTVACMECPVRSYKLDINYDLIKKAAYQRSSPMEDEAKRLISIPLEPIQN